MEEIRNYYYCYSFRQYHFLLAFNQKCLKSDVHPKTHKRFWVFQKSETLDRIIKTYMEMKHRFVN